MNSRFVDIFSSKFSLLLALIIFIATYVGTQFYLNDEENRLELTKQIESVCQIGLRLPGFSCPDPLPLIQVNPESQETLKKQFAKLPDLDSALRKLNWSNGSEIDAVRLITIMRALVNSRNKESRKTKNLQRFLLSQVWNQYPQIALASTCYWCQDQSGFLKDQFSQIKSPSQEIKNAAFQNPSLLTVALEKKWLTHAEFLQSAILHSQLSSAGDGDGASTVGRILIDNKRNDLLLYWVNNGLNGGQSLKLEDYGKVPLDTLISAWRYGASLAYTNKELTKYLVANGYRPALRYIIWYESKAYDYLKQYDWGKTLTYTPLIKQYTRFPVSSGRELTDYYSDHWKEIAWDKNLNLWTVAQ